MNDRTLSADIGNLTAADNSGQPVYVKRKIAFGVDGEATDVSTLNPLPVAGTFIIPPASGSATAVLQTEGNASLASIDSKLTNPLPVSGSLTLSGSIVANAGTDLNTSALALESGGHLDSVDTKLSTINTTLGNPFQSGGSIGNTAFGVSGTLPAFASTPTVNLGTIGSASTAALQTAGNASLASIDSKLTNPLPVSGTVVTGGLTDTQLRASAVPVSGTFFQATQPISGTVAVSNFPASQAVTGPLTDTQLRASAVPISAASLPLPTLAATSTLQSTINTTLGSPFQAGGSIGNTAFGISGTLPAFAATPTFNIGTISTIATAANQVTAQTSLTAIQASVANIPASPSTAGNQTSANTKLDTLHTDLQVINSLTPSIYDAIVLSYTGVDLTSVVFKTGGLGGTTVSTLTLAYTASVLQSVVRT